MGIVRSPTGAGEQTFPRRGRRGLVRLGVVVLLLAAACRADTDTPRPESTVSAVPTVPAPTTTAPDGSSSSAAPDLAAVQVEFTTVATGLTSPLGVLWREGDTRMYAVEEGGTIRVIDSSGRPQDPPVLTVPVNQEAHRGVMTATFSPDGTKLYVQYVSPSGDLHVDEFPMQGDVAGAGRRLLSEREPTPNTNIGGMVFGPDQMLYIGLGDGGSSSEPALNNAQDLGTVLGKILRISPEAIGSSPYGVPADNPFVGRAGARPEIWMYGLRDPWRIAFDRDGTMWIGELGKDRYDEINVAGPGQAAGANWGWPLREGTHEYTGEAPPGARNPLIEVPHEDTLNCSVIGGHVYRGSAVPALRGAYVHGDACNPDVTATAVVDEEVEDEITLGQQRAVTSFGEDPAGELYIVSFAGTISRIDPAGS